MSRMTPSIQDYLKALLNLSKEKEPVRSSEVAASVGVSRASVSRAMNVLKDSGFIKKERYGTIVLTDLGRKTASMVKRRNELIHMFLTEVLGVDAVTAKADSCRMEHTISAETARKLERYLESEGASR